MGEIDLEIKQLGVELFNVKKGVPLLEDLEGLTSVSQEKSYELGVFMFEDNNRDRFYYFTRGGDNSHIVIPKLSLEKGRKISNAVFFHSHFVTERDRQNKINRLMILPSDYGIQGDFIASLSSPSSNYLNIATEFGLTLNVGVKKLDRDADFLNQFFFKTHQYERRENMWKFMSGELKGKSFTDYELLNESTTGKLNFPIDNALYFSKSITAVDQYFLYVPWNLLFKNRGQFGDLEGLCFDDGIEKLADILKIDGVFESNLIKSDKKKWLLPQSREEAYKKESVIKKLIPL